MSKSGASMGHCAGGTGGTGGTADVSVCSATAAGHGGAIDGEEVSGFAPWGFLQLVQPQRRLQPDGFGPRERTHVPLQPLVHLLQDSVAISFGGTRSPLDHVGTGRPNAPISQPWFIGEGHPILSPHVEPQ